MNKNKRTIIVFAILTLATTMTACDDGSAPRLPAPDVLGQQAQELQRQADALNAQATSIVRQTRDAQDIAAQATYTALNARGTAQALSIAATQQANALHTTATTEAAHATARARQATLTAAADSATATAQAWTAEVEATQHAAQAQAVRATAQAIQRQGERERLVQPLHTWGPWLFLVGGIAVLVLVGMQLLPVLKARLGTIQRDERGDLPMVIISQGNALALLDPTRGWGPATRLIDGEISQPMLTEPEYQDGTTKRAQFVDWRKGGRPRPVIIQQSRQQQKATDPGQWRVLPPDQQLPNLPTNVPLASLLDGRPSARALTLGVTMQEDGRAEIVRAGMGELVHVAVGGSSGWGKSVFLRAIAYQLAQSTEPVDLALIDLEGVTFAPFARCDRLLYPVAEEEREALAIFQALTGEMDRRKALFAHFPGVDSLAQYNTQVGETLTPIVCLVDEATALLQDSSVENAIRTLVLRARKYGLWCVLGGQSWKASVLDTTIRDQLASRVQFKAMSASQSRVLLEQGGAERLEVPGRALALLPGREVIEMQAPYISHQAIAKGLSDSGPRQALPASEATQSNKQAARIQELAMDGLSKREIERAVFGYVGGAAHQIVSEILKNATTTTEEGTTGVVAGS